MVRYHEPSPPPPIPPPLPSPTHYFGFLYIFFVLYIFLMSSLTSLNAIFMSILTLAATMWIGKFLPGQCFSMTAEYLREQKSV